MSGLIPGDCRAPQPQEKAIKSVRAMIFSPCIQLPMSSIQLTNLPEQELAALMRSLLSYGTSNIVNGNAKLDRESHTEVNIEQA